MSPHAGEILDDTLGKEILDALFGKCGRVSVDGHEVLDPESFLLRAPLPRLAGLFDSRRVLCLREKRNARLVGASPLQIKDMNFNSHMMSSRIGQRLFFGDPAAGKMSYFSNISKELA